MTKIRVLGLDVSSSTVGWCVLDVEKNNIKYVNSGYFKPSKSGSVFDRLKNSQEKTLEIIEKYSPDRIGIEDIAKYMPGVSSANTILTLCSFNRAIGLACYNYLGRSPELFNVMSIRHNIKKISNLKELPKKDKIPDLFATQVKIKFPYEYKKDGDIKTESFDEGDGCAVALHYSTLIISGKLT